MQKKNILVCSLILALFLLPACGKKGNPLPRGLPLAGGVSDLSGEVKDGVLFLSFTIPQKNRDGSDVIGLAGFRVAKTCGTCLGSFEPFRSIAFEDNKGFTISGNKLYFYDDNLKDGYEYGYKVYPFTKKGTRGDASNVFAVKWQDPPEPPTQISAVVDDGRVELKWPAETGFSYNVYRLEGSAYPLFPVNPARLMTGSYMDSGLTNNRKYSYEVRKIKEIGGMLREGEGAKIDATPADKTPPIAPIAVKTAKGDNYVSVSWKESVERDLAGYNVYRITGGVARKINTDLFKESTYLDRKVPDERFVSYYVTSVDRAGNESEPSRESITILKE